MDHAHHPLMSLLYSTIVLYDTVGQRSEIPLNMQDPKIGDQAETIRQLKANSSNIRIKRGSGWGDKWKYTDETVASNCMGFELQMILVAMSTMSSAYTCNPAPSI